MFSFNPCLTSRLLPCWGEDVAVCQNIINVQRFSGGRQSSGQFVHKEGDPTSLYLRFEGGDAGRKTYIKLICSSGPNSSLHYVSEDPHKVFHLELTTPCACPGRLDSCGKLPTPKPIEVLISNSLKGDFTNNKANNLVVCDFVVYIAGQFLL